MVESKIVQGSQKEKPEGIEVNVDTVYERTNTVQKTDENNNTFWEYSEKQYTFREFLQILSDNDLVITDNQNKLAEEINITQEIVDSLMLRDSNVSTFSLLRHNNNTLYIAMRIMKKEKISIEEAHSTYNMFLDNPLCSDLKEEVNEILRENEKEYLIVDDSLSV